MVIFYSIASLLVVILAIVACYYLWLLHQQKIKQREIALQLEQAVKDKRENSNKSIQILARGAIQGQLTLTEASIRISKLLDILAVGKDVKQQYAAFYLLAEKTAHIPILEDWKRLSTKEKLTFDRQREELENEFADFVVDAAKNILGERF